MGDRNGKGTPAKGDPRSESSRVSRRLRTKEVEHEIGRRVWALPPSASRIPPGENLVRQAKVALELSEVERERLAFVPTFDLKEVDVLAGLVRTFEQAESDTRRDDTGQRVGKTLRKAERLRGALRAAASFYMRGDAALARELAAVTAGDRPAELARELATLVTLVKLRPTSADDPQLEKAVRKAETLVGELSTLPESDARDAAYAKRSQLGLLLGDCLEEVSAALRYLYRDKPKKLARLG